MSAHHPRNRISALDAEISYQEVGEGKPIVLLHGNPTSSYLWRNILPYLSGSGRCLAPDLVGMGSSSLPKLVLRQLSDEEMDAYRQPFRQRESRLPMLVWPRELPIEGEPADVVAIVEDYGEWMASSCIPKLFITADPGSLLVGRAREFCRTWPNQQEITVNGIHFIQEDSPDEIGKALDNFVRHR